MDAPKTGVGGNPRDCRDGTCLSGRAGTDPARRLPSVSLETDQFSRPSRTVETLAASSYCVSAEFLASPHCVAVTPESMGQIVASGLNTPIQAKPRTRPVPGQNVLNATQSSLCRAVNRQRGRSGNAWR